MNTPRPARSVIFDMLTLLEVPERYAANVLAKDAQGRSTSPSSPGATSWGIHGALIRVLHNKEEPYTFLKEHLDKTAVKVSRGVSRSLALFETIASHSEAVAMLVTALHDLPSPFVKPPQTKEALAIEVYEAFYSAGSAYTESGTFIADLMHAILMPGKQTTTLNLHHREDKANYAHLVALFGSPGLEAEHDVWIHIHFMHDDVPDGPCPGCASTPEEERPPGWPNPLYDTLYELIWPGGRDIDRNSIEKLDLFDDISAAILEYGKAKP